MTLRRLVSYIHPSSLCTPSLCRPIFPARLFCLDPRFISLKASPSTGPGRWCPMLRRCARYSMRRARHCYRGGTRTWRSSSCTRPGVVGFLPCCSRDLFLFSLSDDVTWLLCLAGAQVDCPSRLGRYLVGGSVSEKALMGAVCLFLFCQQRSGGTIGNLPRVRFAGVWVSHRSALLFWTLTFIGAK